MSDKKDWVAPPPPEPPLPGSGLYTKNNESSFKPIITTASPSNEPIKLAGPGKSIELPPELQETTNLLRAATKENEKKQEIIDEQRKEIDNLKAEIARLKGEKPAQPPETVAKEMDIETQIEFLTGLSKINNYADNKRWAEFRNLLDRYPNSTWSRGFPTFIELTKQARDGQFTHLTDIWPSMQKTAKEQSITLNRPSLHGKDIDLDTFVCAGILEEVEHGGSIINRTLFIEKNAQKMFESKDIDIKSILVILKALDVCGIQSLSNKQAIDNINSIQEALDQKILTLKDLEQTDIARKFTRNLGFRNAVVTAITNSLTNPH